MYDTIKEFATSDGNSVFPDLYNNPDASVHLIVTELLSQGRPFFDKWVGSCTALSALQEIDNAKRGQYMDLPHPINLCCLPLKHQRVAGGQITAYNYGILHNPASMHLPKVPYHDFIDKFCQK